MLGQTDSLEEGVELCDIKYFIDILIKLDQYICNTRDTSYEYMSLFSNSEKDEYKKCCHYLSRKKEGEYRVSWTVHTLDKPFMYNENKYRFECLA